jgi:hypothetical protein
VIRDAADGVGGQLVASVGKCAAAIAQLIGQPELARQLAERVREQSLRARLLVNELALIAGLASERPPAPDEIGSLPDPMSWIAIVGEPRAPTASHAGWRYMLCPQECRLRFVDDPERFLNSREPITTQSG